MKKLLLLSLLLIIPLSFTACGKKSNNERVDIVQIEEQQEDKKNPELKKLFNIQISENEIWTYYIGADKKRYVFPNKGTYKSWFGDLKIKEIKTIKDVEEIQIGGNVTYRPGSKILKTESVFEMFFIAPGAVLRAITEDMAIEIYGNNWQDYIEEIENHYFTNYKIGKPISIKEEIPYIPEEWTIDEDKNLF